MSGKFSRNVHLNFGMKANKYLVTLLKYAITFFIISWIINKYGWKEIVEKVSQAQIGWLLGGSFLFFLSIIFGAKQWQIILKNKNILLPYSKAFKIYFMGIFFNNFIFGMIAGDTFRVTKLHFDKKDGKASFAATILDRLAGLIALSFYAIIGGIIIFAFNLQQNKQFFMVMGALTLFLSIFTSFFLVLLSQRLKKILRNILKGLPNFPMKDVIQNAIEVTFIDRHGKEDKRMMLQVALLSLVIQGLRISVNIFCAQSIGISTITTIHYFCVITAAISLLMIFPMPLGVRETFGGVLFGFAGFSIDASVIMLFLATIVNVSTSLVGGVLFLFEKK